MSEHGRLIDADALVDKYGDWYTEEGTEEGYIGTIKGIVDSMPTIEPEIIRCKDCKHRGETPIADGRFWCEIHDTFMYYCSDAERMEG